MATTRATSVENGTSFEDFIKSLETSSDEWAKGGAKIGKKGRQRKNKKSVKDESNLCQDLKESYFDQKVIDLRCRETCVLPCFSGIVAKTTFQLFELPDDFYFSIAKILQAGLMTRWHQVYWLPDDACTAGGGAGSGSVTVALKDLQFPFYVFGIGKLQ